MRDIQLTEAKASLSALVDGTLAGEAFAITRHGRREAVVMSWEAWRRLSNIPTFGQLLTSTPLEEGDIADRFDAPWREIDL